MKRYIPSLLLVATGAVLGIGALYVGLHWDRYNPFRDKGLGSQTFVSKVRDACTPDNGLKGVYIKSADVADGKLNLRGWVTNKEQLASLQSVSKALLDEHADLRSQCAKGVSFDAVKVVALSDPLPLWQREFEECKGAEKDTPENAIKREVMRTTRLDSITFDDAGKMIVSGVCVRGNTKTDATGKVILNLLKSRLEAAGVTSDLMPELAIDMHYHANPATALQNKLAKVPAAKDVRVLSAWYDGAGKLHLQAFVTHEDQPKFINEEVDALLKDPQTVAMMNSPSNKEAIPDFVLRAVIFEGDMGVRELQKKLAEHARKENKPLLRRVRLAKIVPTAIVNAADEEGNPRYAYRVTGRLLEMGGDRAKIESELADWLEEELPRMINADQSPILPKLELVARESPLIALQQRVVQRGLDGAVFVEALYDGEGKLEVSGRLHVPGDDAKQTLEAAVKELLADDAPWSIALRDHEASKGGSPIAWTAAIAECQAKLAGDAGLARRVRLDRLYFNYAKGQLGLVADGAFLTDGGENPSEAIAKCFDAVVLSRGKAEVVVANLKSVKMPLANLQNVLTERPEFDGILLTQAKYGADGRLRFDGHLGDAGQKKALDALLVGRLGPITDLLKKSADAEKEPGWSIDDLNPHTGAKGERKWADVLLACQDELATVHKRITVDRAYFFYADADKGGGPRPLALHVKATALVKPGEKVDATALAQKLDTSTKRLFPALTIEQAEIDLREANAPTLESPK